MFKFMGWPVIYEQIPGYIWLFNKFHNTIQVRVVSRSLHGTDFGINFFPRVNYLNQSW